MPTKLVTKIFYRNGVFYKKKVSVVVPRKKKLKKGEKQVITIATKGAGKNTKLVTLSNVIIDKKGEIKSGRGFNKKTSDELAGKTVDVKAHREGRELIADEITAYEEQPEEKHTSSTNITDIKNDIKKKADTLPAEQEKIRRYFEKQKPSAPFSWLNSFKKKYFPLTNNVLAQAEKEKNKPVWIPSAAQNIIVSTSNQPPISVAGKLITQTPVKTGVTVPIHETITKKPSSLFKNNKPINTIKPATTSKPVIKKLLSEATHEPIIPFYNPKKAALFTALSKKASEEGEIAAKRTLTAAREGDLLRTGIEMSKSAVKGAETGLLSVGTMIFNPVDFGKGMVKAVTHPKTTIKQEVNRFTLNPVGTTAEYLTFMKGTEAISNAGFRSVEKISSEIKTVGRKYKPASELAYDYVLSGKRNYGYTLKNPEELKESWSSGKASRYVREVLPEVVELPEKKLGTTSISLKTNKGGYYKVTPVKGYTFTPPKTLGGFHASPGRLGEELTISKSTSETHGLYVADELSPSFLKINKEAPVEEVGLKDYIKHLWLRIKNTPTAHAFVLEDVKTFPKKVLLEAKKIKSPEGRLRFLNKYFYEHPTRGEATISPAFHLGKREPEAIISVGDRFRRVISKHYTVINGQKVPVDVFIPEKPLLLKAPPKFEELSSKFISNVKKEPSLLKEQLLSIKTYDNIKDFFHDYDLSKKLGDEFVESTVTNKMPIVALKKEIKISAQTGLFISRHNKEGVSNHNLITSPITLFPRSNNSYESVNANNEPLVEESFVINPSKSVKRVIPPIVEKEYIPASVSPRTITPVVVPSRGGGGGSSHQSLLPISVVEKKFFHNRYNFLSQPKSRVISSSPRSSRSGFFFSLLKTNNNGGKTLFEVFVKRHGHYEFKGVSEDWGKAVKKGFFYVNTSPSATFMIKPLGTTKSFFKIPSWLKKKAYEKKEKKRLGGFVFIEKPAFRINTTGEKAGITFKGLNVLKQRLKKSFRW